MVENSVENFCLLSHVMAHQCTIFAPDFNENEDENENENENENEDENTKHKTLNTKQTYDRTRDSRDYANA